MPFAPAPDGLIFTYGLTYGGALVALFKPYYGFLVYVCFGILRPPAMWPWSVGDGNYSRTIAIGLLAGWVFHGMGSWQFGRARAVVAPVEAWRRAYASRRGMPSRPWDAPTLTTMAFPATRMRRLRGSGLLRDMVRETELTPAHLVQPLFVELGTDSRTPIEAGVSRNDQPE